MMQRFSVLLIILFPILLSAQQSGINTDPSQTRIGEKPYEMATRVEDKIPIITFEDCTKWTIETENCNANLYRTEEEKLFRKYSGKLVFTPTEKESRIILKLDKPVLLNKN